MAKTSEINFIKLGAVGAILLAVSAFAFFAVAGATTLANPVFETPQFLRDLASKPELALMVAWAQAWLGILTVPLYLGLYFGLRRSSNSYMLLALIAGLAWGILLVLTTPLLFTVVSYIAPAWANETDSVTRTGLLNTATALMWTGTLQISIVFFLRAVSVLAASRVMLLRGGRLWTWMGWLGIAFGVEHIVSAVLQAMGGKGGVNTALGSIGGMMLFIWLIGVAVAMRRLRPETEAQALAASERLPQVATISAEGVS